MIAEVSCVFLSSLAAEDTAPANGFAYSTGGLLDTLVAGGPSFGFGAAAFEFEENFELRLDTQELLRPGAADFVSFWFFVGV